MKKKEILNGIIFLSVLICLFAFVKTVANLWLGLIISIVILSYIGTKIKQYIDYMNKKHKNNQK